MKGLWIDLETTGTDAQFCGIHQVACIFAPAGKPVYEREWLVRPHGGCTYQAGWEVSGKTREQVEANPVSEAQFLAEFVGELARHVDKFERTDKLWWLGYNADFDMRFIRSVFTRAGDSYFGSWFYFPPIDVMCLAAFALRGQRACMANFKLATVYEALFGKPLEGAHDGLADIRATRKIYRALVTQPGLGTRPLCGLDGAGLHPKPKQPAV